MNSIPLVISGRNPKRILLSLLIGVFMISWGLLTLLVVFQDHMLDAQSELIHTLFRDRNDRVVNAAQKISPAKSDSRKRGKPDNSAQISSPKVPSVKTPSTQVQSDGVSKRVPSAQVSENAASQTPSSQVKPQTGAKSNRSSRKARSPFSRPPAELTDPSDKRRVMISI